MKLHTRLQKSFKLCYPIIIPTIVFFVLTHLLAVIQRFSKNSMEYISIATNWIMNLKICIFSPFSFIICYHYMVMLSLNVNTIATLASKYAQKKKKIQCFWILLFNRYFLSSRRLSVHAILLLLFQLLI